VRRNAETNSVSEAAMWRADAQEAESVYSNVVTRYAVSPE